MKNISIHYSQQSKQIAGYLNELANISMYFYIMYLRKDKPAFIFQNLTSSEMIQKSLKHQS
jgi:hypothetical protein